LSTWWIDLFLRAADGFYAVEISHISTNHLTSGS
jgi:hypothetical protein